MIGLSGECLPFNQNVLKTLVANEVLVQAVLVNDALVLTTNSLIYQNEGTGRGRFGLTRHF